MVAIHTEKEPWSTPKVAAADSAAPTSVDPFASEAADLESVGHDPMVSLIDQVLHTVGEDRDLICALGENIYGVLRAPITRPAEPEAFAHSLVAELTKRTSITLWSGVAVSTLGDTPGLLITHCDHALSQARQLGSGQLAVFDEVDRSVVQMRLAEEQAQEPEQNASSISSDSGQSEQAHTADSTNDEEFEPLVAGSELQAQKADKQIHR